MRKLILLLLLIFCTVPKMGFGFVDPTELKLKVYAVYLSTDPYCTNARELFSTTDPVYADFLGNPTLGSIDNSSGSWNGTYHCVIIKMSDAIKYVTNSTTESACTAGTTYTSYVCNYSSTTDPSGTTTVCSNAGEDTSYLYLSTASTQTTGGEGGSPWQAPTSSNTLNGLKLNGAFTISGSQTGTFVVDGTNKMGDEGGGDCGMQPPTFSFR